MRILFTHSRVSSVVLAAALWTLPAASQSLLLKNATVHPISAPALRGDVLIERGKIVRLGHVEARADRVVDLAGQHLYPGLIALNSELGLIEIGSLRATHDETEVGQFGPEVKSWVAVNPDSDLLAVTRANGVAFFEPTPEGAMVAGQSGLMAIGGWTTEDMVVKSPAALHVYWPEMALNPFPRRRGRRPEAAGTIDDQAKERERRVKELADYFADARAYARGREAAEAGGSTLSLNPQWEAMRPYVTGKLPIIVHANELRQIKAAVNWAQTNHYRIVIAEGRDAWKVAGLLASNEVPVIYNAVYALPSSENEPYDVHFHAPEILRAAGVKVAISKDGEASLTKNLPYDAAQAVAYGLPADEALKAITLYPAQIMGVADRLGSIELGKEATLVACNGDILDLRSQVTHLWISGVEESLESRHTRLYEKYRKRPAPESVQHR